MDDTADTQTPLLTVTLIARLSTMHRACMGEDPFYNNGQSGDDLQ